MKSILNVSLELVNDSISKAIGIEGVSTSTDLVDRFINWAVNAGERLLVAFIIFIVGRFLIKLVCKLFRGFLERRKIDQGVKSFLDSLVNILLVTLLIVSVIGALGVSTTSFAALLASAGVAIGMALSGNLQNFAGGVIILLFKPYRIGDFIDAQGTAGTVRDIQIFHTVLNTPDNKIVYVPNGSLSSGIITNVNGNNTRRVEWIIAVEYGEDSAEVEAMIKKLLAAEKRILTTPAPFIALHALADSSVNFIVRGWVRKEDFWGVYFDMNRTIYEEFNKAGIGFPFPQLTIHQAEK